MKFRWLHPISLPLYAILFDDDPLPRAPEVAAHIGSARSAEEMLHMADEIDLELLHPTQDVREILDNPQSEAECRAFLAAFAACVRANLAARRQ